MEHIVVNPKTAENYYDRLVIDYLKKAKTLKPFFEFYPDHEGFAEKLQHRTFGLDKRKTLVSVLKDQYKKLLETPGSEKVKKNIDALLNENTLTVTTGQQIHIYLGPLYVTYKILSTIARCEWLAKNFKGYKFVPVFWMATEDHDFEEISDLHLFGKSFSWQRPDGNEGAVGRMTPGSINELEPGIAELFKNDENAQKLLMLFTEAYKDHSTFAAATRQVVHSLFKESGLIVLDADNKKLKELFRPYIAEDIINRKNAEAVNVAGNNLEKNYKAQINPREINFFYLDDKNRRRIVFEDGKYKVLGTDKEFDEVAITYEIDKYPERFSPNVVMRPLYQEVILPNLSYIGGPAEVAYWLQLKGVFGLNGVQFPVIELRKSVILVSDKAVQRIKELGLKPADMLKDLKDLEKQVMDTEVKEEEGTSAIGSSIKKIDMLISELKQQVLAEDAGLLPFIEGESKRIQESLERIGKKMEKSRKKDFDTQLKQLQQLKSRYFDTSAKQERVDNLLMHNYLIYNNGKALLTDIFKQDIFPLIILNPPLK